MEGNANQEQAKEHKPMLLTHLLNRERAMYMTLLQKAAGAAKKDDAAMAILRKLGDAHELYRDAVIALDKMQVDAFGGVEQAAAKVAERAAKAKEAASKRAKARKK